MESKWMSRKFWLVILWQTVITVLLIKAIIPVAVFESLTWLLLGGYLGVNVAQKVLT
jgi:uncharacterized membrane protein